jgi:CO dehydrogenase nickel-insertion accessory protein CooC1
MKQDIERIFVVKNKVTNEDREKAVTDKYLRGEITIDEMVRLLEVMRPKQLKPEGEFSGYQ